MICLYESEGDAIPPQGWVKICYASPLPTRTIPLLARKKAARAISFDYSTARR